MSKSLRVVALESPYHSEDPKILKRNIAYAIQASKHSLTLGDVPFPSHLIFTQLVKPDGSVGYVHDGIVDEFGGSREKVIEATQAVRQRCDAIVMYVDFGVSNGMAYAAEFARKHGIPIEERRLPTDYLYLCVPVPE
jgi:hypothetical protein